MEAAHNISASSTSLEDITTVAKLEVPVVPKIVVVTCPTCRVQGKKIFLPESIQQRARNPSSIVRMLFSKEFCTHAFIAYLDSNMNIKGYEAIDFVP